MSGQQGTLAVKLKDALQLPVPKQHALLGRKLSPYVILTLGDERQQSRTNTGGHRSPVWLQDFKFTLEPGVPELRLEVFHDATFSKDTLLCIGSVPAGQLTVPGWSAKRVFVECTGDSHGSGEIHLDIMFTPTMETAASRQMSTALSGIGHMHGSSSLETAPSRSSIVSGAPIPQPHRTSLEGSKIEETPSWLTGSAAARPQEISSKSNSPYTDQLENGSGRQHSLQPGDKLSVSPTKSFRKRMGKKFGKVLGSKSKDGKHDHPVHLMDDPIQLAQQPSAAMSTQSLEEIPEMQVPQHILHSTNSAHPLSSNQSASATSDADSQTDYQTDPEVGPGEGNNRGNNEPRPQVEQAHSLDWTGSQESRRRQGGMEAGEGSNFPTRTGSQWLNHWEGNPRRVTESAMPDHNQRPPACPDPRRQTETYERTSSPMFEQPSIIDPNRGYFRGGREVREWSEHAGPVQSMFQLEPFNSRSDVIPFMNQRNPDGAWDMSSKHERIMSAQREVMRQPWNHGAASHDPLSAATTQMNLMDDDHFSPALQGHQDAMKGPKDISSSLSALELGWNRQPGAEGPLTNHPIKESRYEAGDPDLIVEPRRLSDSVPSSWQEQRSFFGRPSTADSGTSGQDSASNSSYPQPDYGTQGSISDRMAGFESRANPSIFAQVYARSRHQDPGARPQGSPDPSQASQRQTADFAGQDSAFITPGSVPRFADGQSIGQNDNTADADISSFVGFQSPFAADQEPLQDGPVPLSAEQAQPAAAPSHRRLGSETRVPMRDVQARIESATMSDVEEEDGRAPETRFSDYEALLSLVREETWLIDENDLEIDLNERGDMIKLGSGSFGTVYRGVFDHSTEVAIKCLPVQTKKLMDDALHEVAVLKQLQHPHVVQFLGASIGKQSIQLVTELMAGNLYKALQNGRCTWHKGGKLIAKNVASALAFLYKKKIVHLDIKSANILLSSSNTAKIGDLGLSAMMGKGNFVNSIKGVGTMAWAAPEVLLGGAPVTCAADVFSFGTVLWEICSGQAPVRGYLRELQPHEAPAEVSELILKCLEFKPEDRPTMHQAYDVLKDL